MCSFEGICERGIHRVMDVFFRCRKLRFLIKQHKKSIQRVLFMYAHILCKKGKNFIHVCSILCMKRKIFICEEK